MNKLINLQWWNPQVTMNELDFNRVQFWVQVQVLPLEFISEKNASKILSLIREVIGIEDPKIEGKVFRPFIRARVELDIRSPLSMGCWIPRKNMSKIWAFIKYERLQDLCYKFGVIGHEQKTYKKEKVMSLLWENAQRYIARVGVAPTKSRRMIVKEMERRRRYQKRGANNYSEGLPHENNQEEEKLWAITVREMRLNRERHEYEERLEEEEGQGSLPSGWEEVHTDGQRPPNATMEPRRRKVQEVPILMNLRLHEILGLLLSGFRATERMDISGNPAMFGIGDGLGAGNPIFFYLNLTDHVGLSPNPTQIPHNVGYAAAGVQNHQSLDQRVIQDRQKGKNQIEGSSGSQKIV